jgi:hypothetical protein
MVDTFPQMDQCKNISCAQQPRFLATDGELAVQGNLRDCASEG